MGVALSLVCIPGTESMFTCGTLNGNRGGGEVKWTKLGQVGVGVKL